jgi:hypothetical protein
MDHCHPRNSRKSKSAIRPADDARHKPCRYPLNPRAATRSAARSGRIDLNLIVPLFRSAANPLRRLAAGEPSPIPAPPPRQMVEPEAKADELGLVRRRDLAFENM